MSEENSYPLVELLKKRERKTYEHDISSIVKVPGPLMADFRVPTKVEQDRALAGAHRYVARVLKETPEQVNDPDLLADAKAAFIVAEMVRQAGKAMPHFNDGEHVIELLSADQIRDLVHICNVVRGKESGDPDELTDELIEALVITLSQGADSELPERLMAGKSFGFSVQLNVLLACKLVEERAKQKEAA